MNKLTSIVVATVLALGTVSLVNAETNKLSTVVANEKHKIHECNHADMYKGMIFKKLDLTDAQKTQMKAIMQEAHKDMPASSADERRTLHSIIASDNFDSAKAEAQAEKMSANSKTRALNMMKTQNKLYNLLTPAQKKQYNAEFAKQMSDKSLADIAAGS